MAETKEVIIPVKTKGVDEANKEVQSLTGSLDEQGESLTDLAGDFKIFGVSVNSVSGALKKSTPAFGKTLKSLGKMKIALAGLGIGLAIAALASFSAALRTSKRVADEFSDAGAFMSAIVDQMTASFGDLFSAITETEDGTNRFTAFLTNVSFGLASVVPGMTGLVAAFVAVGNAGAKANKELREFQEGLARQNLEVTKIELAIEQLVNQTRRLGVTGQEQFDTITEALILFNDKVVESTKVLDTEGKALQSRLDAQVAGSQAALEAQIALTEFQIKRLNTERMLSAQQRELLNRQTEAFRKAALERRTLGEQELEFDFDALDKELTAEEDFRAKIKALDDKQTAEFIANAERVSDAKVALAIKDSQARIQLEKDTANAALSILAGVAEFSKEGAIAAAFVNLGLAISKVFGQTGVFGFAAVPAVIAAIGSAIGTIRAAKIPAAPTFAHGGYIGGNLHSQGGTMINAERGEYMINRRAMQDKGIADIAQALNNYGQSKGFHFQDGGFIGSRGQISFAEMDNLLSRIDRSVLVTEDLNIVQSRTVRIEERATL